MLRDEAEHNCELEVVVVVVEVKVVVKQQVW
jgi:hypothetical protein